MVSLWLYVALMQALHLSTCNLTWRLCSYAHGQELDWSTRGPRCNGQELQFETLCLKKDAAPRRNLCVCHSDTSKLRESNQFIQTQTKYIQLDCEWRRITQLDASCEKTSGVPSCPHWADGSTNMARLAICTSLLEARGCAVSPVVAYLFDFVVQDCLEPILDVMYININNIHAIIHAEAIVIMIGKNTKIKKTLGRKAEELCSFSVSNMRNTPSIERGLRW